MPISPAFSSRFFNTNVLFLYSLYSSFFFWCLVQSGLFLFLKLAFLCYSSTALAGRYSCVTLTLTLHCKYWRLPHNSMILAHLTGQAKRWTTPTQGTTMPTNNAFYKNAMLTTIHSSSLKVKRISHWQRKSKNNSASSLSLPNRFWFRIPTQYPSSISDISR